jgi:hypothetical protein
MWPFGKTRQWRVLANGEMVDLCDEYWMKNRHD